MSGPVNQRFRLAHSQHGSTPLHEAARRGHHDVIALLLRDARVERNAVKEVSGF